MTVRDRHRKAPTERDHYRSHRLGSGQLRTAFAALCVAIGLITATFVAGGCAVNESDLRRWEMTLGGPQRLRAVVLHDKYPHKLRVEAAMSLIRMKPRKGKRIGVKLLVSTLAELQPEARNKILADLIPMMITELKREVPPAQPGQPAPPDPSFKYKDAAYVMLTYDRTHGREAIVPDPALAKQLKDALVEWAMADFERRLNDRSQAYAMEQLLRHIGPDSVKELPKLMTTKTRSLQKMAQLIQKICEKGSKTRQEASVQLVTIAKYVNSEQWRKDKAPELKEANRRAKLEPSEKEFEGQMSRYQEESLMRIFGSMKRVGGNAAVEYCFEAAMDKKQPEKRRQHAVAALEGNIDPANEKQIDSLFKVVSSDAPNRVLDQAFHRIREMPRDKVVAKLYALFKTDRWLVRRAAAATVLQMSQVKHIGEFMKKLDENATKNFSLSEPINYGAYLGELKSEPPDLWQRIFYKYPIKAALGTADEGNARVSIEKHLKPGGAQSRTSAFGYFYSFGTKDDLPKLKPYERDRKKIPKCSKDEGCGWQCEVPKANDPKKTDIKEVKTVGDFVTYCIKPKVATTTAEDLKKDKKKDDKGKKKDGEGKKGKGDKKDDKKTDTPVEEPEKKPEDKPEKDKKDKK